MNANKMSEARQPGRKKKTAFRRSNAER